MRSRRPLRVFGWTNKRRAAFRSAPFSAERYERRSLGITSNLVFSEWDKIFQNPMATAAAIDRVVHHVVILEFDVPSYRADQAQRHQDDSGPPGRQP